LVFYSRKPRRAQVPLILLLETKESSGSSNLTSGNQGELRSLYSYSWKPRRDQVSLILLLETKGTSGLSSFTLGNQGELRPF